MRLVAGLQFHFQLGFQLWLPLLATITSAVAVTVTGVTVTVPVAVTVTVGAAVPVTGRATVSEIYSQAL